tara:strand:+ start:50548 stop:51327 length:780 start_codon:yes stop_codon:yes gene_type:complete
MVHIISRILILTLAVISLIATEAIAQGSSGKDKGEDAFRELETGELTLRFINALNGEYVEGARVLIDGREFKTDFEGKVLFKPVTENSQSPVLFEKEGYITSSFGIEIALGTIFQNRISVSPILRPESIRIVLDWAKDPRDLDAHLIKQNGYHISFRHKRTSDDGTAQLDRDDTNGNGPETITINEIDQGETYTFMVENFSERSNSNSKSLSNKSRATVRVYGDNQLLHTFRIPPNEVGVKWSVFQIKNGQILNVDTVN